ADLTTVQDILPTLLDLAGIQAQPKPRFDGMSLAGYLRGERPEIAIRTVVIQFSRMNAPQPTKGDACVMRQSLRLVGNAEVYDLRTDPSQMQNQAPEQPYAMTVLRAQYDEWWKGVAPKLNEFSPIVLGSETENPALLSACEWADVFLDQMAQVRRGE